MSTFYSAARYNRRRNWPGVSLILRPRLVRLDVDVEVRIDRLPLGYETVVAQLHANDYMSVVLLEMQKLF